MLLGDAGPEQSWNENVSKCANRGTKCEWEQTMNNIRTILEHTRNKVGIFIPTLFRTSIPQEHQRLSLAAISRRSWIFRRCRFRRRRKSFHGRLPREGSREGKAALSLPFLLFLPSDTMFRCTHSRTCTHTRWPRLERERERGGEEGE